MLVMVAQALGEPPAERLTASDEPQQEEARAGTAGGGGRRVKVVPEQEQGSPHPAISRLTPLKQRWWRRRTEALPILHQHGSASSSDAVSEDGAINDAARGNATLEHTPSNSSVSAPLASAPNDGGAIPSNSPRQRSTVRHDGLIVLDGDGSDLVASKV